MGFRTCFFCRWEDCRMIQGWPWRLNFNHSSQCQFKLQTEIYSYSIYLQLLINMSFSKPRALSVQKVSRINSSKQKRRYQKVQTQQSSTQMRESSHLLTQVDGSFSRKVRAGSRLYTKDPEEIMQQNMNLKAFINGLQEQLSLQRSRLQVNKRKNQKVVKQINRQFQKQMYYSGKNPNGYMISGVKQQYENMKNMYEQKCDQIESIIKNIEYTSIQELKLYNEALEAENRSLRDKLQTYIRTTQAFPTATQIPSSYKKMRLNNSHNYGERLQSQPSQDKSQKSFKNAQVVVYLLAEERNNMKKAKQIIEEYCYKIQKLSESKSELVKKVDFLQKLVIEKDNNEHEARKQSKKSEKQKIGLQQQISKLNQLINSTEAVYKKKIKLQEQRQSKKYEIQRQIFQKSLLQKNQSIKKLQKQIRFLSTMLSYWKPLDEINRQFQKDTEYQHESPSNNRQLRSIEKDDKISASMRFKVNSEHQYMRQSQKSQHSGIAGDFTIKVQTEYEHSIRGNRQDELPIKRTATDNRNRSGSNQNAVSVRYRERYMCDKKHSEAAKKARKVDINQIRKYGQLLRYRLLGYHVDISKVKQYFSNKPTGEGGQLQNQYIKMKEIKHVLQQNPFCLKEEQALLISRYVVEDSNSEHVYWDEQNQIDRNIAKSIIKAFIGQYKMPNLQKNKEEWLKISKIYLPNMLSALKTIAPKGLVSLSKFTELIVGLGIEMAEELQDWLIGEMVIQSSSLQELRYDIIVGL